jgi:hypothetical protein
MRNNFDINLFFAFLSNNSSLKLNFYSLMISILGNKTFHSNEKLIFLNKNRYFLINKIIFLKNFIKLT